mmetsp:Transcript_17052/g.29342  ORF Transcript_17052/g.29342 Transcript_17052/m.29342 type:complete len:323 (-) Transcript_17052:390-1358(-)
MNQGRVAMSLHDHLVVPQLLGHIPRARSGHLDPRLGEECAGREDEDEVEHGVEGIVNDLGEGGGRGDVVGDASHGDGLSSLGILPLAQNAHEDVGGCAVVQELTHEVEVGHQGRLQDDGHVGGVEQLDGVCSLLSAVLLVLDGEDDPPSLEVDDDHEDEDGGGEVGEVGQVLAVDGLLDGADLVVARDEEVEERDDGALELGSTSGVDGGGTEGLPDNVLADVGGDEETDTATETVSLLEELVEGEDDESGAEELGDDEEGVTGSDGGEVTVHSADNVGNGLANSDEDSKELLGTSEEGAIFLDVVVDLNDATSCQELHDQS